MNNDWDNVHKLNAEPKKYIVISNQHTEKKGLAGKEVFIETLFMSQGSCMVVDNEGNKAYLGTEELIQVK